MTAPSGTRLVPAAPSGAIAAASRGSARLGAAVRSLVSAVGVTLSGLTSVSAVGVTLSGLTFPGRAAATALAAADPARAFVFGRAPATGLLSASDLLPCRIPRSVPIERALRLRAAYLGTALIEGRAEDRAYRAVGGAVDGGLRLVHQARVGRRHPAEGATCGDPNRHHLRRAAGAQRRYQAAATGRSTAADSSGGQATLLETERRNHRQRQGEHPALAADVDAELRTALALAQVPAQGPTPQLTGGSGRQLLADLGAGDLAGAAVLDQGRTGLEHERLHLLGLTFEHLGYRSSRSSARRSTSSERPAAELLLSTSSTGCSRRARNMLRQRLRAIV